MPTPQLVYSAGCALRPPLDALEPTVPTDGRSHTRPARAAARDCAARGVGRRSAPSAPASPAARRSGGGAAAAAPRRRAAAAGPAAARGRLRARRRAGAFWRLARGGRGGPRSRRTRGRVVRERELGEAALVPSRSRFTWRMKSRDAAAAGDPAPSGSPPLSIAKLARDAAAGGAAGSRGAASARREPPGRRAAAARRGGAAAAAPPRRVARRAAGRPGAGGGGGRSHDGPRSGFDALQLLLLLLLLLGAWRADGA